MGGGIAVCFASAGIPVTLIDASAAGLERGTAGIERVYQSMVDRGRLSAADKAQRLALIRTSLDYQSLKDADVIIEAVFEDLDLKRDIFRKLDVVAKPGAILATNTSTLDIAKVAEVTSRPGDVIGMHFSHRPTSCRCSRWCARSHVRHGHQTVMELANPCADPLLARCVYGFSATA